MIGKLKELLPLQGGEWLMSFVTRENPCDLFDDMKDEAVKVEIRKASKHRSLSANAFAWVLMDKIAEKTGYPVTEVYQNAIREIGGISDIYGVKEEAFESFRQVWTEGHLGRQVEIIPGSTKPGWLNVKAWKGSSDFDSRQMSMLIDSLIQEAEQQGIPTIPDKEVERIKSQWQKASCKTENDAISAAG